MPSIELKGEEETALNYASRYFDGNLSMFLRTAVKEYGINHKKQQTTAFFQTVAFLLISICFLLLAVSFVVNLISILIPSILALCGLFLFVYVCVLFKESRRLKGGSLWTSK